MYPKFSQMDSNALKNPKLKKIRRFLSNLNNINRGGCGFAAVAMYDILKQQGFEPVIMFAYHSWNQERYQTNEAAKKCNGTFTSCSHAFIKIDDVYFDCARNVDITEYRTLQIMGRDEVVMALKEDDEWNYSFDRDANVPTIEKMTGIKIL